MQKYIGDSWNFSGHFASGKFVVFLCEQLTFGILCRIIFL